MTWRILFVVVYAALLALVAIPRVASAETPDARNARIIAEYKAKDAWVIAGCGQPCIDNYVAANVWLSKFAERNRLSLNDTTLALISFNHERGEDYRKQNKVPIGVGLPAEYWVNVYPWNAERFRYLFDATPTIFRFINSDRDWGYECEYVTRNLCAF